LENHNDGSATIFKWRYTGPDLGAGGLVALGIDLRQHVLLAAGAGNLPIADILAYPADQLESSGVEQAVSLGFRFKPWQSTYISGLHFEVPTGWDNTIWVKLDGVVQTSADNTPVSSAPAQHMSGGYQDYLNGEDVWISCATTQMVSGPGPAPESATRIHGNLLVVGSDLSTSHAGRIGIANAVVVLTVESSSGLQNQLYTLTDNAGHFEFRGASVVACGSGLTCKLRVSTNLGNFAIRTENGGNRPGEPSKYDGFASWFAREGFQFNETVPFGLPQIAVHNGDNNPNVNNLRFLLKSHPFYESVAFDPLIYRLQHYWDMAVVGNSYTVAFWQYQLNEPTGVKELSASSVAAVQAVAAAQWPLCSESFSQRLASSASSLQQKFAAVALNRALGRGLLGNAFKFEDVWTRYAYHVACELGSSATSWDVASAEYFLDYVLEAR